MKLKSFAFLPILLAVSASSVSAIRSVPDQYASIQVAIDGSTEGDTVLVAQGTYEECINFVGKNIMVTSVDPTDPHVVANTVIKGDGSGSVVTFTGGENHRAVLAGFTITGGGGSPDPDYADSIVGGGIYCYRSSPSLRWNTIVDNHTPDGKSGTYGYGGGICCIEASPTMICNTIKGNSAYYGGGIFIYVGEARIASNMIYDNSAEYGGGVTLWSGGQHAELAGNTVTTNKAKTGANVVADGRSRIGNNIIAFGEAEHAGGILWVGGCPVRDMAITFNNVYGNSGGDYFGVDDQTGRNGNISQDPLFADFGARDFHIQSDSPCVSAGDPAYLARVDEPDTDGDPRVLHKLVDIGADEYVGYVRPIANAGEDQYFDDLAGSVTLDAGASSSYESGEGLQYEWRQVGGTEVQLQGSDSLHASFVPRQPGTYCFELTVSDAVSKSRPDRVSIVVGAKDLPVADAGLTVYATTSQVPLDGTRSYTADDAGNLSYEWRQISGPTMVIVNARTATPTIHAPTRTVGRQEVSTFIQTDQIQICEFELLVGNGELVSRPDMVQLVILPDFGTMTMRLENPPFDPDKPTIVYFGGGDGVTGYAGQPWSQSYWANQANVLSFPQGYGPDTSVDGLRTYYKYGAMIVAYLSGVAREYSRPIQTIGWSTGGQPAIEAAAYINFAFQDARYAVNRVTGLDGCCCDYSYYRRLFNASAVGGEQCWADFYWYANVQPAEGTFLGVDIPLSHAGVRDWYGSTSLSFPEAGEFGDDPVAGAYWSVIGPGKNLQLATRTGPSIYRFVWSGSAGAGHLEFVNESLYPGRLPEPVTLAAWLQLDDSSGDINGPVLSCHESENAVGYELLLGADPDRVMDFRVVSDTPSPPMDVVRGLPSEETWWTVRVRDQFGSTIHADPVRLDLTSLAPQPVGNARTGKRYGLIEHAFREAEPGDTLLLDPATYEVNLAITMPLTLSSLDPDDPTIVAGTILRGRSAAPTVTFVGPEGAGSMLAGLTIQSETVGVSCRDAVPTIRNCAVESRDGIAVEFWHNFSPELIDCTIVGRVKEGGDPGLVAYWRLDETEGMIAHDSEGKNDATIMDVPLWHPEGGKVGGALQLSGVANFAMTGFVCDPAEGPFSVFAWVKGGGPGQVILSQAKGANWLMAAAPGGVLATDLKESGRSGKSLVSGTLITDGNWHRVGLSWDGSHRILYVDDKEVAADTQANLAGSSGNLYIGTGSTMSAASFWSGLIDDVRIYDRAVKP